MEHIIDIIKSPSLESLLGVIIASGLAMLYNQGRRTFNRIRLSEFKQIATMYALGRALGDGFLEDYEIKLDELKADNKFKIKGE